MSDLPDPTVVVGSDVPGWRMHLVVTVILVVGAVLAWLAWTTAPAEAGSGTDPRVGWVNVRGTSVGKVCDGHNLLYRDSSSRGHAITVSENDPQCGPTS